MTLPAVPKRAQQDLRRNLMLVDDVRAVIKNQPLRITGPDPHNERFFLEMSVFIANPGSCGPQLGRALHDVCLYLYGD